MNHKGWISLTICLIFLVVPGLCISSFANNESGINTEAQQHFEKANELRKLADYDAAITEYEKVITLSPDSKIARNAQYWIGQSYFEAGQLDAALTAFQKLLDEYPESTIVPSTKQMIDRVQQAKKNQALYEATEKGDIDRVKQLVDEGAEVNAGGNWTALHVAASKGYKELAKLLIDNGADVNAGDGWTALHGATYNGREELAKLLIDNGADVNAKSNWSDKTPLNLAVTQNNKDTAIMVAMAEHLLNHGAKLDVKDSKGRTAFCHAVDEGSHNLVDFFVSKGAEVSDFHLAAFRGDLAGVKRFLEQGMSVDMKDSQCNCTPLYWAACSGALEVAEFLIAKGADVNAKRQEGRTPLHMAVRNRKVEIAELLISSGANIHAEAQWNTPLSIAVENGHTAMVEMLARKAGYTDAQRWIPLHIAVNTGDQKKVEQLLSQGADVNIADDYSGYTALHWAVLNRNKNIVEMLIAKGADINAKGGVFGATPIQYAAGDRKNRDIVNMLIAKGADIHAKDERWGNTAMHYKAWRSKISTMSFLLDRGWDIEATNFDGGTPLGHAVSNNQVNGAKFLIDRGANVNVRYNQDTSYLHKAIQNANPQIVELLLDGGADVDIKTKSGKTPLDLAKEKGHTKIVELLKKHGAKE